MTSALFVAPHASLRLYNDATDRSLVTEMVREVYSGGDYVPELLPTLSTLEHAHAFVLPGPSPPSIDAFAYVVSIGAGGRRCPTYLLGAVRVNPARRGVGVGRKLVELVEKPLLDLGAERVVSMTDLDNEPMRRIFEGLGWKALHETIVWPMKRFVKKAEGSVLENFSNGAVGPEKAEKHAWEPCRSVAELQATLERLAHAGGTTFIPAYFKVLLAERLEEECQHGKVWVGKESGKEVGVVALSEDWEGFRITVVSICTKDPGFLESALSFVENNLKVDRYVTAFDASLDLEKCPTLDFRKCEPEPVILYQKTLPSANL